MKVFNQRLNHMSIRTWVRQAYQKLTWNLQIHKSKSQIIDECRVQCKATRFHDRKNKSEHVACLLQALVLLATLASIEFYPECQIPPSLSSKTTVIPVPADGSCFWSCLWLATEATPAEVFGWFKRPRNKVGMPSSKDGFAELQKVKSWAHSLESRMHRFCQQRLKHGLSAEHEDIVS